MPLYNLIECSSNYSETTGSLWFCSKDEATNFDADVVNNNNFKSFEYKTKLLGNTAAHGATWIFRNAATAVPLKYLSNVWRSLEILLINCKIKLKFKCTKYCILFTADVDHTDANHNIIIFTIKDKQLHARLVLL